MDTDDKYFLRTKCPDTFIPKFDKILRQKSIDSCPEEFINVLRP